MPVLSVEIPSNKIRRVSDAFCGFYPIPQVENEDTGEFEEIKRKSSGDKVYSKVDMSPLLSAP